MTSRGTEPDFPLVRERGHRIWLGVLLLVSLSALSAWAVAISVWGVLVVLAELPVFVGLHEGLHAIGWKLLTGEWPHFHWRRFAQTGRGIFTCDALRGALLLPVPLILVAVGEIALCGGSLRPAGAAMLVYLLIGSSGDLQVWQSVRDVPVQTLLRETTDGLFRA